MLGRVSALNIAGVQISPELTQKTIDLSRTPVIPGSKNILADCLSTDVLAAYSIYEESGVDKATEYLIKVARKQ